MYLSNHQVKNGEDFDISYKPAVAIVGNFVTSGSSDVFLRKFIMLLNSVSPKVLVLSDWNNRVVDDSKVKIINDVQFITTLFNRNNPITKLIRYLLVQLVLCYSLLKFSKHYNTVVFFDVFMSIPMYVSKLSRKRTVFVAAGRNELMQPRSTLKSALVANSLFAIRALNFRAVDSIIIESKKLVDWLKLDKNVRKISLGPTFVDMSLFQFKDDYEHRKSVIGYIGNLSEAKGVMQFFNSIPLVSISAPETTFLIVGHGLCYDKIRSEINGKKLGEKIELRSWVKNSDIPEVIQSLRLLVVPSFSEGLPNIVLEAMACGTPVLAVGVGGIPDVIKNKDTGFLLNDNSPETIAAGVVQAINYPKMMEIIKKANYLVNCEYSFDAAVQRYKRIFNNQNDIK